jgi:dihydroflavonol-4-reductase
MKALVTGANGLVGANLVRELLADGHQVRAFVRASSDLRSLAGLAVEFVYGDVLEPDSVVAAARGCDVLFHTAAVFAYWGMTAKELERIAVDGTLNVLHAAHRAGVPRMVFTSSSVVLGSSARPLARDESFELDDQESAPYVIAKALQERAAFVRAAELGVELIAVLPTMSMGPHGYRLGPSNGVIVSYLNDPFKSTFPGGCNVVSVRDVARGHILAAEHGTPGERYVLGSENLEWQEIHRMISELSGVSGPHWHANHTTSFLAASVHELAARVTRTSPLTTRTQARMVGRYFWYRHSRAAALGYNPRPARQALAEAISWMAASEHISRQTRSTMWLSHEVYQARRAMQLADRNSGTSR